MRLVKRWSYNRRVLLWLLGLAALCLLLVSLSLFSSDTKPLNWTVHPAHRKLVHGYVRRVLGAACRHGYTQRSLEARLTGSHVTQPFLWKDTPLPPDLFLYPPPFGFKGYRDELEELLNLLPSPDTASPLDGSKKSCRRCVVMGNGGILRGLELGALIDKFDTIIRLNSGPLGQFSVDVGNRTSIRMSYPEGTPRQWMDTDRMALFVAVVYKAVDLSWVRAMVQNLQVPLWDRLFFWQKVPDHIPLGPERFRVLNLQVIKQTALDLLSYPPPRQRLWGWDQNIPTLGVSAVTLASLLCDEVSLAGFGYNLSQQGAPLHYYDSKPMSFMLSQTMHNVDREGVLLRQLVREGVLSDLTGGLHCSFCPH